MSSSIERPKSIWGAAGGSASVGIRPGVGVLGLFPNMNYKTWYALAELVDNALASYLQSKEELHQDPEYQFRVVIEIDNVDEGNMRIWDNAAGIAASDYQRAFVTADPPTDPTGLSQFGIGMKSASCFFARNWSVRTTALGEEVERTITFDVPRIVSEGIEELIATEIAAPAHQHFTEIRLWGLNRPLQSRTLGKMKDHLASMYRVFIRRGDMVLTFNGEVLEFSEPEVLVAKPWNDTEREPLEWKKTLRFELETGERVFGSAGLRKTASTSKAGFALFRNERLVMGSDDETYRPNQIFGSPNTFRYQRVFGEIHLEGFDVSHTKDAFIWGDQEDVFLDRLREELDSDELPLLRQAENYRARVPSQATRSIAVSAVASTAEAVAQTAGVIERQLEQEPEASPLPPSVPPAPAAAARTVQFAIHEQMWEVTIELTTEESVTDWLTIADQPSATRRASDHRRLEIRVALSHPFMMQFAGASDDSIEPLLRVAAGIAVSEVTAREAGVRRAGTVRRNLNELLRTLARR